MTIDLDRDPSLSESAAFALFGDRQAELSGPATPHLSRYTATRNLPTGDPVRAVQEMEATLAAVPDLRRRQGRRAARLTSKPALCYTVYWEQDHTEPAEIALLDESLRSLGAERLQTLIVGRRDYPPRSHVIVNVVDPSTGRVGISPQPYYELMRWHLGAETDPEAAHSLEGGLVRITVDSLRRQDHRLLDLPPLFAEAVRGVPGYDIESNALRMVHRAGPSTFHTAEFIDTVHREISEIEENARRLRRLPAEIDRAARDRKRRRETRRKILIGEYTLRSAASDPRSMAALYRGLDRFLSKPADRAVFEDLLPPPGAAPNPEDARARGELLSGFRPKKHEGRWCAIFEGDTSRLPADLSGWWIEIQPSSSAPWAAPVLEVLARSASRLMVRTPPKNILMTP